MPSPGVQCELEGVYAFTPRSVRPTWEKMGPPGTVTRCGELLMVMRTSERLGARGRKCVALWRPNYRMNRVSEHLHPYNCQDRP